MNKVKTVLKYLLSLFFVVVGISHFVISDFFVNIMPPYLPWHLALVYISGVCEIGLGLIVLLPRYTALAAWGLIALLIAVFPANIHMALNPQLYPHLSPSALYLRLPLQGVFIAWAYLFTRRDITH
ncbi:MAG: DoxX family protein [Acidobacteriota bacterium]